MPTRNVIIKKKRELKKKYKADRKIYSSGTSTSGKDFPLKMKINLKTDIIKNNSKIIK